MKSVAAETKGSAAWKDGAPSDIESECETWDWARTAGVSAAELREALRDSLERKTWSVPDWLDPDELRSAAWLMRR